MIEIVETRLPYRHCSKNLGGYSAEVARRAIPIRWCFLFMETYCTHASWSNNLEHSRNI